MTHVLNRQDLHAVQLVPITAFDEQGRLNLGPMRDLFERVYDAGIRVFIPCAGSAEFDSLTSDEIVSVIEMARKTLGDEAVILAPVGKRLGWAVDLGKRCMDAGASAILVMPLAFAYISNAGARDYYTQIMEQVAAPTLLYKKAPIPADELLLELADHPHLWGVKYAVNDLDAFTTTVRHDGGRIDWFCGSAERFCPFYTLAGSPGYTSGAGSLCPHLTLALHQAMKQHDWTTAMHLHRQILPIEHYRARDNNSYNISFLKYAIKHIGLDFGEPRTPQRRLTSDERHEIDCMMPELLECEAEVASEAKAST